MSNFLFSSTVFATKKSLDSKGFSLSRAQLFELIAASFGYHQYKEMLPNNEEIEAAVVKNDAIVILDNRLIYNRALDLLGSKEKEAAAVVMHEVVKQLSASMPGNCYPDESTFIDKYVEPSIRDCIDSGNFASVLREQEKISATCTHFSVDCVEFPDLNDKRYSQWSGEVMGQLCQTDAKGQPEKNEDQVLFNAGVTFEKLDRCILARDFDMRVGATAIRPDPSAGGFRL